MSGRAGRSGEARRAAPIVFLAFAVAITAAACSGDAASSEAEARADGSGVLATRPSSEAVPERFGVGRPASEAEVAALDIDVMPDGTGLPPGRGSVAEGSDIYAARCAACHGAELEGTPLGDRLVPHPDFPMFPDGDVPIGARTIGNYWPHATTIFDYVRRAMPFDRPGSMSDDEVYAVTAFLLWKNGIIQNDAIMDPTTLPDVVMPARDRFVDDDRLESNRVR